MARKYKRLSVVLLLVSGLLAILVGVLGAESKIDAQNLVFAVLSVGGGAVFGTSLSLLLDQVVGSDISDIRDYLFKNEKLESAPDYIEVVLGKWHVYYVTKQDGCACWRYGLYDLRRGDTGNSIIGEYGVSDRSKRTRKYLIEAGIRGTTLVLISKAGAGQEQESIEIVPRIVNTHLSEHVGVQLLETWDGDIALTFSIYSRRKLTAVQVMAEKDEEKLNAILRDSLEKQKIVNFFHFCDFPEEKKK